MYRITPRPTTVVAVAILACVMALPAAARPHRFAGPWYTPSELKALDAYAAASFVEKRRILAGAPTRVNWHPLTARERTALEIYAKASFAEKQRILAGRPTVTVRTGFKWGAAAGGGISVLAVALIGFGLFVRRHGHART